MEVALVRLLGLRDLSYSKERFLRCAGLFPRNTDNAFLCKLVRILLIFRKAVEYLLNLRVDLIDILHPRLKFLPSVYFAIGIGWVLS